jgi:hypothetical protein
LPDGGALELLEVDDDDVEGAATAVGLVAELADDPELPSAPNS